jgi:hypothetical protein
MAAVTLAACGPAPAPPQPAAKLDPTTEPWYAKAVDELPALDRQAEALLKKGKGDDASALIQKGEPLASRLLGVPRPTLGAMEAASDLDQLYGQMLFSNRNYGWARLMFQKNVARWKRWTPVTPEVTRRLNQAEEGIASVDRRLTE